MTVSLKPMKPRITNQKDLRREFWQTFPNLSRVKIRLGELEGHRQMYLCDTRCAFVDWLDSLHRDGAISDALAQRATL